MIQEVKVGGFVFAVQQDRASDDHLRADDAFGETDDAVMTISVLSTLALQAQQQALLHELVHAITGVFCGGKDLEEEQIEGIAHGFLALVKDNPQLLTYLQGPGDES